MMTGKRESRKKSELRMRQANKCALLILGILLIL